MAGKERAYCCGIPLSYPLAYLLTAGPLARPEVSPMECRFERTGTIALFTPEGRIDSAGAIRLDAAIREHLSPTDIAVLFDMSGVSYMSSAGIRVFMGLEKALRQKNGHLHLFSIQPPVQKVLGLTGFHRVFSISATKDEALCHCSPAACPAAIDGKSPGPAGSSLLIPAESFPEHEGVLKMTGTVSRFSAGITGPEDLIPRIFSPDEYLAGLGAPGESAADCLTDTGILLTAGGAIFWKPAGSTDPPDFLIPSREATRVLLNTAFAVSAEGQFHEILMAESNRPSGVRLADLCTDIFRYARSKRKDCPPVIGVVMYAGMCRGLSAGETGTSYGMERTLISTGLCIDSAADLSAYGPALLDEILISRVPAAESNFPVICQAGLVFDAPPDFTTRSLSRIAAETIARETCTDLVRLTPDTRVSRAIIGIHYISRIELTDRMPVRISGPCVGWNQTYETIARWMHPGCREVTLTPLTGGFSGTLVFRVSARDGRGQTMMPMVMKLGEWPVIEAEIRGYTGHVKRYIQNNATQIIETERIGNFGGILYNFVGIRGAESKIFSLEDFYLSRDTAEILPVFDALFRVVLQGWYGGPKQKEMALYREYNRFWKFDDIRTYAKSRFGALPDQETIDLPFGLGESVNPVWFVENVMPRRMSRTFPVYESSVHGDLNMKNVLMDETGNLWLIDFAETRYSHILRDIVKLEAVIKGEMIPVQSRETLVELVRLDLPFLSARGLSEIPEVKVTEPDPAMEKAFRVVQRLRNYANQITPGDDDITQYYLGLLPYTLNLLSYSSVNEYQKEYGWIAASLICQRLMETVD